VPADVIVRGAVIESVRTGGGTEVLPNDSVVDRTGLTVMPGLVDSHCHLTFPSALGHIDPSFNPPVDVSFFHHMPTPEEHLEIAKRNALILLDHGFTSAYSAGSLTPVPTEVFLRDRGRVDGHPVQRGGGRRRRRAGQGIRCLAQLPRAEPGVDQAGRAQRVPLDLPLLLPARS
jgi:cytosine/adenosine deaminase-related metal-dependent hydrolase